MRKIKHSLPLLLATLILSGCGSETNVDLHSKNEDKENQLIVIKNDKDSIFQTANQQNLANTYYFNDFSNAPAFKDGKNLRQEMIDDFEARIAFTKELKLSKNIEAEVLAQLNEVLSHFKKWQKFENELTAEHYWEAFEKRYPKEVELLKQANELKKNHDAYLAPYITAYNQAKNAEHEAETAYQKERDVIADKLFEYVIENEIVLKRNRFWTFASVTEYIKENNKCSEQVKKDGTPLFVVESTVNDTCYYGETVYNRRSTFNDAQIADLNKIVDSFNNSLVKKYAAQQDAREKTKLASKELSNKKVIASNKFQNIGDRNWLSMANRISNASDGFFNTKTYDWGNLGDKGNYYTILKYMSAKKLNMDLENPRNLLNEKTVFLVYNDLLNKAVENAEAKFDVDSDGSTDIKKDQYVDNLKLLVSENDEDKLDYALLKESKDKDDVRLLSQSYSLDTSLAKLALSSKLDYATRGRITSGINWCEDDIQSCLYLTK